MIKDTLSNTGLPVSYSHFKDEPSPPYIVYIGNGQNTFSADNTWTFRKNQYQVEYYFTEKNEAIEESIEQVLLEDGFNYVKSEDVYIDSEDIFVIYYTI